MATPTTLPASFVAGNVLTAAQMNNLRGAFRVLQVVSTTKTDTFTTTSTTYTDVTGLSVNITPSATSSLVLVNVNLGFTGITTTGRNNFRLMRGATAIGVGDLSSNRTQSSFAAFINDGGGASAGFSLLDSPATTSLTTYKLQGLVNSGSTLWVNRTKDDTDAASWPRTASSITVMEISA